MQVRATPPPAAPPVLTKRSTPQVDHLFSTLVEAAFDLIDELGSISLNIYLHVPHDDQPLLFTRNPTLDSLSPTETFRLMHTITMLSNGRKPVAAFRHGALSGHYVRTTGSHSDGLFVFGEIQTPETARRIVTVSRSFARVLHQFHLDDGDEPLSPPVLTVEKFDDITHAAVTMDGRDTPLLTSPTQGTAAAQAPEDAVAMAVLNAIAPDFSFGEVRTIDVGTRSAVLVVVHDPKQALRIGLAISDGDVLQTTAVATLRALVDNTPTDATPTDAARPARPV